ncbi:NAD-dependent epimerase/dehydratase family protein [Streptomyces profundus]|uniref:NAD-dependent epimerase/dehydratase family protein n=1 Tax=Streptomyces profundus TaxID=2867410 RepID=UPI001D16A03B|nr:NAD-dependent epimerase/dehydratase [Streptomyces sp. MA3_2.13]UED87206.1 NAD-dependent epimerase/dehydratase [Streptomyces sp. MA3_2.13]
MSDRPRVVLLGATGFVGSTILAELAREPLRVRAVARREALPPADAVADVEVRTADLTEPGAVAEAVADADVVIHSIAYIAGSSSWRIEDGDKAAERVNVDLVRDVVRALRDRPGTGLLFVGACSQVGPSQKAVLDGSEPDEPKGEYDRQKLAAERIVLDATAAGLVRGASIRLPTVFGPSAHPETRDKGVVSLMAGRALAGQPITMWHDGTVRRDLLPVRDVARALVAALGHVDALAGRHWLLGTGVGSPLGDVFRTVAGLVAERTGKPEVPVLSVDPPEYAETTDFRDVVIDPSRFASVTGWRARTPLSEALRETVEHCHTAAEAR